MKDNGGCPNVITEEDVEKRPTNKRFFKIIKKKKNLRMRQ